MYFGATNWVAFNDMDSSFAARLNNVGGRHPGCIPVLYSITMRITNGATAGPCGVRIYAPGSGGAAIENILVDFQTDFDADMTDTIHVTWPGGLPVYQISSTEITLTDAAYHEDKATDSSVVTFTITPVVVSPGDTTIHGIVCYGWVPAAMVK